MIPSGLASCLMVTQASRWKEGPPIGAVAFDAQLYAPRELVLVTADPCDHMQAWAWNRRFPVYIAQAGANVGQMRNLGLEVAAGDFLATWDDDDWSAPERLSRQVETLCGTHGADACFLARAQVVDVPGRREFVGRYHAVEPTMVAWRTGVAPYDTTHRKGNDYEVISRFPRVVLLDRPDLFRHYVTADSLAGLGLVDAWYAERSEGGVS